MTNRAQCDRCKHYIGFVTRRDGSRFWICNAYPEAPGIPDAIVTGEHDHRKPFDNDRGITFLHDKTTTEGY